MGHRIRYFRLGLNSARGGLRLQARFRDLPDALIADVQKKVDQEYELLTVRLNEQLASSASKNN